MKINFSIEGEFVTNTAREWFYIERKPFSKVKHLLLSCMENINVPEERIKYVVDILKFRKKFIGNTKNNTFCLTEELEKNNLSKYFDTLKIYGLLPFEICEYGFIDANGEYIPVEWSNHSKWAAEYIEKNYTIEEQIRGNKNCYVGTDFFVYIKNWILISNPLRGKGIVKIGNKMTKKQKETLYDYYIFFNRRDEANKLYKEK